LGVLMKSLPQMACHERVHFASTLDIVVDDEEGGDRQDR
jgi:hypothetical protein